MVGVQTRGHRCQTADLAREVLKAVDRRLRVDVAPNEIADAVPIQILDAAHSDAALLLFERKSVEDAVEDAVEEGAADDLACLGLAAHHDWRIDFVVAESVEVVAGGNEGETDISFEKTR